jgi:hypothetical protein
MGVVLNIEAHGYFKVKAKAGANAESTNCKSFTSFLNLLEGQFGVCYK